MSRFDAEPTPELIESAYWYETNDAPLLHHALTLTDLAYISHLDVQKLIPHAAAQKLLQLLVELDHDPNFSYNPKYGDAFTNRERWLSERAPEVAGYLSTGRARREGTTVAFRLVLRRGLLELAAALIQVQVTLLELAARNSATLMPDYTYLQQAQPTSFAHYLLSFVFPLRRDFVRVQEAFRIVNQSPAGIGSTNGARLPVRRERLAELLGFDSVITHTRDAMWQVDVPIQTMNAAATLMMHLDRLAQDLQIFNSTEFGFIELSDTVARASVIMPQKKNPYPLAFVRGAAGSMLGRVTETYVAAHTPSAQVDNRIMLHGAVPRALDLTTRCVALMNFVCGSLTVHPEKMAHGVADGFTQAMDLAEALMQECALDYRTAHQIVGRAVRQMLDENKTMHDLTSEQLDLIADEFTGHPVHLSRTSIAAALDPSAALPARSGVGGAAPGRVQEMIQECRADVEQQRAWANETGARINNAENALRKEIGD